MKNISSQLMSTALQQKMQTTKGVSDLSAHEAQVVTKNNAASAEASAKITVGQQNIQANNVLKNNLEKLHNVLSELHKEVSAAAALEDAEVAIIGPAIEAKYSALTLTTDVADKPIQGLTGVNTVDYDANVETFIAEVAAGTVVDKASAEAARDAIAIALRTVEQDIGKINTANTLLTQNIRSDESTISSSKELNDSITKTDLLGLKEQKQNIDANKQLSTSMQIAEEQLRKQELQQVLRNLEN